jgi:hypothetical protein
VTDAHRRRRQRGQALLEFAVVLPVFMVVLLGMIDLGRVIWANDSISNAAREAARFAIVHGGSRSTACPVGPPAQVTIVPPASSDCPFPSPSKQSVREVAFGYAVAGGGNIVVQVCYGAGCTGDTDATGATNARGTPVTVTVSSQVYMIVGSMIGLGTFSLQTSSTMLVNH